MPAGEDLRNTRGNLRELIPAGHLASVTTPGVLAKVCRLPMGGRGGRSCAGRSDAVIYLWRVALTADEFYARVLAAADDQARLPLSRTTGWEISPFEQDGLRVTPLRPPVASEAVRDGEDPANCRSCRQQDVGIWLNDRWRLTRMSGAGVPLVLMLHPRHHHDLIDLPDDLAAEMGILTAHIGRHIEHYRTSHAPTSTELETVAPMYTSGSSPALLDKLSSTGPGWSSGTTYCRSTPTTSPQVTPKLSSTP